MTGFTWLDIAAVDDIPLRGARKIKTAMGCVALFRTGPEEAFAATDRCPHKGGPLSEGIVHGQSVTCPLHNWVFDLNTGQAQGADAGSIAVHPVRVEGGRVLIDAAALLRPPAA
ncbi:nitrite reductase small subunit NirD [Meridianimarinicoccus sp. RP-17]|uniref:nitrite reductase small subunit NirD n=1 Tax=Meridianimarinicoccus zhengii TaxID=2056810 RepID=UPI000DAC990B|nr:nitrite reductase small subunit NirD [Phycocomes zhengii]